jgi:hypothetical protein
MNETQSADKKEGIWTLPNNDAGDESNKNSAQPKPETVSSANPAYGGMEQLCNEIKLLRMEVEKLNFEMFQKRI